MLKNEFDLCRKIMQGEPAQLIPFHYWACGSGFNFKKRKNAYRMIKVRRVKDQIVFEYNPEPYQDENTLSSAYALMYQNCPAATDIARRYYFGDFSVRLNGNKEITWAGLESFVKFVSGILSDKIETPAIIRDFNSAFYSAKNLKNFWEFINQTHKQVLSDPDTEGILKAADYCGMFFHFDLTDITSLSQWYDIKGAINAIDQQEIEFVKKDNFQYVPELDRYCLNKSWLHTVTSGDDKSENQFVDFDLDQRYKTLSLSAEELPILFYHADVMEACKIPCVKGARNTELFYFQLVPSGPFSGIDALHYLDCLKKVGKVRSVGASELAEAEAQVTTIGDDPSDFLSEDPSNFLNEILSDKGVKVSDIEAFDLILIQRGSRTLTTLGEINNLSRSTLRNTLLGIQSVIERVKTGRKITRQLTIKDAFIGVHQRIPDRLKHTKYPGHCTSDIHLQKFSRMMFKLFQNQYYGDAELISIWLDSVEYDVRRGVIEKTFYDKETYYLLLTQLTKGVQMDDGNQKKSSSKELGRRVGCVAWPIPFVIGSFEKSQVGYLSHRVSTIQDARNFFNHCCESVIRHVGESAGKFTIKTDGEIGRAIHEAAALIAEIESQPGSYDREAFQLGFHETYHFHKFLAKKE